ncbi:MAG: hypothetical protein ABFS02_07280 [Pseudomonadota bacterium]
MAAELRLGEYTLLGKGESMSGGGTKTSILADVFESVLAAVYLDGGIRAARSFVFRHLKDVLKTSANSILAKEDYKTSLQETMQARVRAQPLPTPAPRTSGKSTSTA